MQIMQHFSLDFRLACDRFTVLEVFSSISLSFRKGQNHGKQTQYFGSAGVLLGAEFASPRRRSMDLDSIRLQTVC
jgi:hypothetical protein